MAHIQRKYEVNSMSNTGELAPKATGYSKTEQTHVLRYQHLNGARRLFGGQLMQWIDELAGIVAGRHSGSGVVTAAVDNLIFKAPAYLNDLVVLSGRITYTGKTSMEVQVDTYTMKRDGQNRKLINTAYLVMVSTDEDGAPLPVPGLLLQTDQEKQDWADGEKRYNLRKQRRKEQF